MLCQFTILLTISVLHSAAQTPPGFIPGITINLGVTFPKPANISISPGLLVSPLDTVSPPAIHFPPSNSNDSYLVVMLDLDVPVNASTRTALLHWMAQDLTYLPAASNATIASVQQSLIAPYIVPAPTPGSGTHRYILTLFKQPQGFKFPPQYSYINPSTSEVQRANFNLSQFAAVAGLGAPVAATYWLEVNGTANGTASATGSAAVPKSTGTGSSSIATFTGAGQRVKVGVFSIGLSVVILSLTSLMEYA